MSERTGVLLGIAVLAVSSLLLAVTAEEPGLAGFNYPGSELVWAVAFGAAGAVITKARPNHVVGRLFLWSGLAGTVGQLLEQVSWGPTSAVLFVSYGLLLFALARFPDGEWVSGVAKWLAVVMSVAFVAQAILWQLLPVLIDPASQPAIEENPPFWVNAGISIAGVVGVAFVVAVLVGQIRIARRDPIRRRQIGVVILGGVVSLLAEIPLRWVEDESLVSGLVNSATGLVFPVTVVIAVTRYRLYEIDRVLSRTVSYAVVIGAMALVYLGVFLGLGSVLELGSDTEVALATLAAVAVSVPLLRRVRRWVDRRFFRNRYDSARVVARVAEDLRTTVDLDEVEQRVEAVVEEVFAPEGLTVWLAEDRS